ncbi:MAG: GNAT family N-acetyltransferase [Hyphomicrobiales bacterium]
MIETKRLRMREWRESDLDAFAAFRADAETCRHIGALSRDEAWRTMAYFAGHWSLLGFGLWSLELRSTGSHIGYTGLYFPKEWPEPEVGWGVYREHQGHGYATEAAAASLAYAYGQLGWATAISLIAAENLKSIAVASRLGARPETPFNCRGQICTIYRHLNPENFKLHSKEQVTWQ